MLLFLSAKFLRTHGDQLRTSGTVSEDKYGRLDELKRALLVLQNGNNLAMNYLDLLELDCFNELSVLSSGTEQHETPCVLDIMNLF